MVGVGEGEEHAGSPRLFYCICREELRRFPIAANGLSSPCASFLIGDITASLFKD